MTTELLALAILSMFDDGNAIRNIYSIICRESKLYLKRAHQMSSNATGVCVSVAAVPVLVYSQKRTGLSLPLN